MCKMHLKVEKWGFSKKIYLNFIKKCKVLLECFTLRHFFSTFMNTNLIVSSMNRNVLTSGTTLKPPFTSLWPQSKELKSKAQNVTVESNKWKSMFCQHIYHLTGFYAHLCVKIIPLDHFCANIDDIISNFECWEEKMVLQ